VIIKILRHDGDPVPNIVYCCGASFGVSYAFIESRPALETKFPAQVEYFLAIGADQRLAGFQVL